MTAASGADQPTLRDQLAEALRAKAHWCEDEPCPCVRVPRDEPVIWASTKEGELVTEIQADPLAIVGLLLPLIEADRERAKAEGGVEALEKAARIALPASGVRGLLLDRAAALRGSTGGAR